MMLKSVLESVKVFKKEVQCPMKGWLKYYIIDLSEILTIFSRGVGTYYKKLEKTLPTHYYVSLVNVDLEDMHVVL